MPAFACFNSALTDEIVALRQHALYEHRDRYVLASDMNASACTLFRY